MFLQVRDRGAGAVGLNVTILQFTASIQMSDWTLWAFYSKLMPVAELLHYLVGLFPQGNCYPDNCDETILPVFFYGFQR
jgi:hypothetical protein